MKLQNPKWFVLALLVMAIGTSACAPTAPTPVPTQVAMPTPVAQHVIFPAGQTSTLVQGKLGTNAVDRWVLRVEAGQTLRVNLTPSNGNAKISIVGADGMPLITGNADALQWSGTVPQSQDYTIDLISFNDTAPTYTMQVTVSSAPGPAPTVVPTLVPTAPTQPAPTQPPVPCLNAVVFVADVNYPDGTAVTPNLAFNKTWRIRNTGTCAWTTAYQIVRVAGEQMSAADAYGIPPTAPGATADLTVPMTAPATAGMHESRWQLRDPNGAIIQPFYVSVKVNTVIPAPPQAAILSPGNGFQFASGTTVHVSFQGASNYTEMSTVALYANGQQLAKQSARTPSSQITGSFDWQPGPGNYDLYTFAVDINGQSTNSAHIVGAIVQPQPQCQLSVDFRADRYTINAGEHTTLRWDVDCANAVYLNGQGVTGHQALDIAPNVTTSFTLHSIKKDGSPDDRTVTITVNQPPPPPPPPQPTPVPQRRNITGIWRSGNYSLELGEAIGCPGADCGVGGRLIETRGVTSPVIDNVQGTINVYSGAMSLALARPGAAGISCNVAANSASMSCQGSFGSLTFTK